MELVTVRTFDTSLEAHLVKTIVENEGIACFLFDENLIQLNPLWANTIGGIKLKVKSADLELAHSIVEQALHQPTVDEQNQKFVCPKCNSEQFYFGFKSAKGLQGLLSIITAFLFSVYPIHYHTVNKCKQCGHELST